MLKWVILNLCCWFGAVVAMCSHSILWKIALSFAFAQLCSLFMQVREFKK